MAVEKQGDGGCFLFGILKVLDRKPKALASTTNAEASVVAIPEQHPPYKYTARAALVVPGSQNYDPSEPGRRAGKNLDTKGEEVDTGGRGQYIGHY